MISTFLGEIFGSGYLEALSEAITSHIGSGNSSSGGEIQLLNAITEPLIKRVVQVSHPAALITLLIQYVVDVASFVIRIRFASF